jgi:hypothetical protein
VKDLKNIILTQKIPKKILTTSEGIVSLYVSTGQPSAFIDDLITKNIEQKNLCFKDCFSLVKIQCLGKEPTKAAVQKMTTLARISQEVVQTLSIPKILREQNRGDYGREIAKGLNEENRIAYETWINALEFYQKNPEEELLLCSPLKTMLIKKTLISSNSPEVFLGSPAASKWDYLTESALHKMKWPVEQWRTIIDSPVPVAFKKIAHQKIEGIRNTGTNRQLISQT